ncbi:MAG: hypothetical protein KGV57_01795 [Fusobacterium sp.]|nr:hypothetical protein [Fusobacterium sp.]
MKIKNKKMILIDESTFNEVIDKFLKNPNKYIAIIRIRDNSFDIDYSLIKYLKEKLNKEILGNVIAITDKEYMANDLDIEAVLYTKNLKKFDIEHFVEAFTKFRSYFLNLKNFLEDTSSAFTYTLDYYNYTNPWFFSINNYGVLLINDFNYHKILNNYHKITARTSDIILIALENKEEDVRNKKLLRILCADSLITFGVTNKNSVKFYNYLDLILYSKGKDYFENSLNYVKSFIKKNKFTEMRDFFDIEEKSFEVDLFFENEAIKKPKKYEMILSEKKSYSKKNYVISNAFKENKSKSEYFIIKKIY